MSLLLEFLRRERSESTTLKGLGMQSNDGSSYQIRNEVIVGLESDEQNGHALQASFGELNE